MNLNMHNIEAVGLDVPIQDEYPSFTDRYFSSRYRIDVAQKESEDHCVLFHSNKICVVTLALTHPIIRLQKKVQKIDFQVAENTNRLNNIVKGKRKHGAQCLQPLSVLCVVSCEDGSRYSIRSCIVGKLLEINESLLDKPELLLEKPNSDGYIAIVLPNKHQSDKQKGELMSHDEYLKAVERRKLNQCDVSVNPSSGDISNLT